MCRLRMVWIQVLLLFIALILPVCAMGETTILTIRHWSAPDHTRVVIDTSRDPRYTVEWADQRVGIVFTDASFPPDSSPEFILHKPGIDRITVASQPTGIVKVELWLAPSIKTNIFKLRKFGEKPDRVVIDIGLPEVEKKESEARQQVKSFKKDKIVVIDPGHGGDDPGAVGKGGTQEKSVVLDIGRKLRDFLNGAGGFRAFLTRDGDYYLSLKKRREIAREYGADLFLSIHADAARNRRARGSSVYCLSSGAASSEAAKILARKENLSDIIGGSGEEESNPDESAPIVLTMFQTNTLNQSKQYGGAFLRRLDEVGSIKFAAVQGAPFSVLKLPDIPSLLVETAYISNPVEERLLSSNSFKLDIARVMAISTGECLSASPTAIMAMRTNPGEAVEKVSVYRVKKGDTLRSIAVKHDTTVSALLGLNRMKLNDPLYVDRRLRIPSVADARKESCESLPTASSPPLLPPLTYTVRKGDTIAEIARRHGTTINALLKLNRMKLQDPLYAGRVLRIRGDRETRDKAEAKVLAGGREGSSILPHKDYIYRVKRGDTLKKISHKYKTTVSVLLNINRMKRSDPLYVDQELKLPVNPSR